jgi:hypothetical protein
METSGQLHAPTALAPRKKLCTRLGGFQGRYGSFFLFYVKRKVSFVCRDSKAWPSSPQQVAIPDFRQYNINLFFVLCFFVLYLSFFKLKGHVIFGTTRFQWPCRCKVRSIFRIREMFVWIPTGTSVILSGICRRIPPIDDSNAGKVTRIVHDRFFPGPIQFTIHQLFWHQHRKRSFKEHKK